MYFALAWVRMCDFRLVDWANFLLQPSKGQTYGRSPVWMRTCVLRLKSNEKRLPQPSKVHWKGFSPVCTSWCRLSLDDSTKALPHSAQTCTRGPCVCRCFRMAELSRNILVHPLWGQAIVLIGSSLPLSFFGFILSRNKVLLLRIKKT